MGKVISFTSNKGGVLKTSLTVNIAGVLSQDLEKREFVIQEKKKLYGKRKVRVAEKIEEKLIKKYEKMNQGKSKGKKVLIIDMDNQGNVAVSFRKNPDRLNTTLYDVLVDNVDIRKAIVPVHDNIDLLASNDSMIHFELDVLMNHEKYPNFFKLLKDRISVIKDEYDYILVDSPPNLGLATGNVLATTDYVIIPFQPEAYSLRSLVKTIQSITGIKKRYNKNLEILGVVGTLIDGRTVIHSEILQKCRQFGEENNIKVYETIIPRSIRFANSVAYEGLPATLSYQYKENELINSYFELVKEMGLWLNREKVQLILERFLIWQE